ncbi:MAG: alpha/beta hydrolase-fold protein [bacterium]
MRTLRIAPQRPAILTLLITLCILLAGVVWGASQDILTITHFSKTLNREKTFQVYVPLDSKPGERFPVLFVLHGAWGSYSDWVSKTTIEDLADNYRMVLVFPDGGEFGWYADSPVEKDSQYDTYVAKDLVGEVDRLFPTVATREARAIMGLSMGGHGALLLAAKHPDLFSSASSLSGILKITDHPDKWQIAGRLGGLDENPAAWKANSVWEQADRFTTAGVRLLFDCGTSDTITGAIGDNRKMHDRLVALGVPHVWRELPGTHAWTYWQDHLEEHLDFHAAAMLAQTPELPRGARGYLARQAKFLDENSTLTLHHFDKPTVCLLGSSSMEGFPRDLLPDYEVFNRGISGDVLGIYAHGITHRLEASVFDLKPHYIFIKNGRNDLGNRARSREPSIERMIAEYEKIILTIQKRLPDSKLVIVTCAPVRDRYAHLAAATHSFDMQLIELAKKHKVPVIDLYKDLVGGDGLLKPEYSRDGLHFNRAGYEILASHMIAFISSNP